MAEYFAVSAIKERKTDYAGKDLLELLKQLWLATDQMCGKRLKAAIPLWLPAYEETFGALELSIKEKLLKISPATIDRFLKPCKALHKRRGLPGTRPGYLLKTHIPIKTDHWDVTQPGFLEADTVAHGGDSVAGDYVWSITLTDIFTGWTEIRATWNKGAEGVLTQIKNIEKMLPFSLRSKIMIKNFYHIFCPYLPIIFKITNGFLFLSIN
jgi:hypothetical protein